MGKGLPPAFHRNPSRPERARYFSVAIPKVSLIAVEKISLALLRTLFILVLPAYFRRIRIDPDRVITWHIQAARICRQRSRCFRIILAALLWPLGLGNGWYSASEKDSRKDEELEHRRYADKIAVTEGFINFILGHYDQM